MLKLKPASLDWALKNVERFGDTDIFPAAFEFAAVRYDWTRIKAYLAKQDLDTWIARPQRTCLAPKGQYSYRIATQLDPLDSLIFLGLLHECGADIESARRPVADRVSLSHRFAPDASGQLYSTQPNWGTLLEVSKEHASLPDVEYVVIADISDFYPRLYHHRVQNALVSATNNGAHARVLTKLISAWAGTPSYGLPVGPAASRLIAEISLDDVDRHLLASGARFCRYVDDYRIFCTSRRDAYEKLTTLAEALFQIHGLTLQPAKTSIVTKDEFLKRFIASFEETELSNLEDKYEHLLSLLDVTRYDEIEYDELDEDQQALIDELNLEDLLEEQINGTLDVSLMKFILRRLAQIDDSDPAELIIENAEHFYPVLVDIIQYFARLDGLLPSRREAIGTEVIKLLESSTVAHLPYHRSWLLSLLGSEPDWGQTASLVLLFNQANDSFSRRELITAMGHAHLDFWFRTHRNEVLSLPPWERRAFLAAASCWPKDEREHWYRSIAGGLDELDKAVVEWAKANPY